MREIKLDYNTTLLTSLARPADFLRVCFQGDKGARIGQSTVASQKLHTLNPARPEEVKIMQDVDAGRIFYQRTTPGEVYHLDIFHQCGLVDHRKVAAAVKKAVDIYSYHHRLRKMALFSEIDDGAKADYIDVQTGTGGGRITGALNYGRKLSLRRAHENHVHVSAMLPAEHLECLFYIVMAVEEAITACGFELRRNERIIHGAGGGGSSTDMSPYSDVSDSFLRQRGQEQMPAAAKRHQHLQDISELSDDFDSPRDLQEMLQEVAQGADRKQLAESAIRRGGSERTLDRLSGMGLVELTKKGAKLTDQGQELMDYLQRHLPEVEAHLRKAFQLLKPEKQHDGHNKSLKCSKGFGAGKRLMRPECRHTLPGELAVAETVNAAACRAVAESLREIAITAQDLRHFVRKPKQKAEICLVIDASASMSGSRIRAAKFLARHLLLTTPDPISIITFQAESAQVGLAMTRDIRQADESLRQLCALGSTPLASGLRTCLEYLGSVNVRNPLIILITDGMATIGDKTRDPLADAIEAAKEIKTKGYGFTCIGLKPHRQHLLLLAKAAGGTVCVLDELEKHLLVRSAWVRREQHLGN
jgi:magnesium chelatase subunit D